MTSSCLVRVILVLLVAIPGLAQTQPTPDRSQNTETSRRLQDQPVTVETQRTETITAIQLLTVDADTKNPVPNQVVHFRVTSKRPLHGPVYHFDWGDGGAVISRENSQDHAYSTRGAKKVVITVPYGGTRLTGELTINVRELKLIAEPSSARVGDQVKFTASLDPPDESAQYKFYFDDKTDYDSSSSNVAFHAYSQARNFRPSVVAIIGENHERVPGDAIGLMITTITPPITQPGPGPTVTSGKGIKRPKGDAKRDSLTLTVVPGRPLARKNVIVIARLNPPREDVRYEFDWADGSKPEVVPDGEGVHRYARAGQYTVWVSASTTETYPVPLIKRSITVGVSWLPSWVHFLLALGAALAAVLAWRLIRRPPSPRLRAIGYPDAGVHEMARIKESGPHVSLTLKPGMDASEDRINIRENAAAD